MTNYNCITEITYAKQNAIGLKESQVFGGT